MKTLKWLPLALLSLLVTAPAFAGKCTVSEYVSLPRDGAGNVMYIGSLTASTPSQEVSYTTSTRISTALQTGTRFVRIYCDAEARVTEGGSSAAATADSPGLAAGSIEFFYVPPSSSSRYIAVYDGTS